METTIERSRRLTNFLEIQHRTSDVTIDSTLDSFFSREQQFLLKERAELRAELDQFEHQYSLESSEFSEKFECGEMGDDMDFFDWSATWDMYQSVQTSLEVLEPNYVLS